MTLSLLCLFFFLIEFGRHSLACINLTWLVKSSWRTTNNRITVTFCEDCRQPGLQLQGKVALPPSSSSHVFFLLTPHMGIRPEYIHLSHDGIYIRMTNLLPSPHEGLGLHVKMQVKSGRQWFVTKLHISSSALFLSKHTSRWCSASIFGFWGKRMWRRRTASSDFGWNQTISLHWHLFVSKCSDRKSHACKRLAGNC